MPIAFLENSVFDSDTTRLLGAAFETAWQRVKTSGITFADERYAASAREVLAKRIIEMAKRGERNPNRLVEGALDQLATSKAAEAANPAKPGLNRRNTGNC
jgi:hypothetical protein